MKTRFPFPIMRSVRRLKLPVYNPSAPPLWLLALQVLACIILGACFIAAAITLRHFTR